MVEIRNAAESDLDVITHLWRIMMDVQLKLHAHFLLRDDAEQTFQNSARDKLANNQAINLVAHSDGNIAGFCFSRIEPYASIYVKDRYCLISDLSVHPEARRQGVADRLFDAVRRWSQDRGVCHFEVNVADGNEPAQSFWESLGFSPLNRKYTLDTG